MQPPTDARVAAEIARRLAARTETDPDFFGAILRRYQVAQGFDDARLASHFGVSPDILPRLAICRRPRHDAEDQSRFRSDVETIAEHFGIDSLVLADVVRFVDVLDAMSSASAGAVSAGFLAAARERVAEDGADYDADADHDDDSGEDR